mgnify:FL=1
MKINLKRINDDYLFKATNDRGHEIVMDNKTKEEGFVQGVSPMETLLMGLAGCSSIDIIYILKKQKLNPEVLKMEVEGFRKSDEVPALFHTITIVIYMEGNLPAEKVQRAADLSFEKYCSVSKTLEATASITHKVVLNGKPI